MNKVEKVQERIVHGLTREVAHIRVYTSYFDGNQDAVAALKDASGATLVAKLTRVMLEHMGHDPDGKNFRGEQQDPASTYSTEAREARRQSIATSTGDEITIDIDDETREAFGKYASLQKKTKGALILEAIQRMLAPPAETILGNDANGSPVVEVRINPQTVPPKPQAKSATKAKSVSA